MNPHFWRGRRVFLTGHTGFKGAWLALWLQMLGADVRGYSLLPPSTPSMFDLACIAKGMRSTTGDIRDVESLTRALADHRPEVVFHLAAQALVHSSYVDPVNTYSTNVMGTVHLLEATRSVPEIRAVVVVTSDKCYENHESPWPYRENEAMGGFDPYSSSKGCAELVTAAYRRSFFSPDDSRARLASARAGNVIGGGDWAKDRLLPDCIRALSLSQPVHIRCPNAIRPWQHVLEPLSGYLLLAEKLFDSPQLANAWNFGPEGSDSVPVSEVVERVLALWGNGACWCYDEVPRLPEAHTLRLDCTRAKTLLGWSPRWNLEGALSATVAWYKAYYNGENLHDYTMRQIRSYAELLNPIPKAEAIL